jgi:tRNA/rRNA methyltransferase
VNITPAIILVRPQLVENIGAAARAMMNCNLSELRLVEPRDGWPLISPQKERAAAAASGADSILENARLYKTTAEAVSDLNAVYATTARSRDMIKPVLDPRGAITEIASRPDEKIGLLFGPERTGLINDDLLCAGKIIHIPANPDFSSFNLAQSVLILAYEWLMQAAAAPLQAAPPNPNRSRLATQEELLHMFDHLERELEEGRFFSTEAMKPTMVQNLRNIFLRASLTDQEVRTFRGVITALTLDPTRKRKHG